MYNTYVWEPTFITVASMSASGGVWGGGAVGVIWSKHPSKLVNIKKFNDEYGRSYTRAEFWDIVNHAKAQTYDHIGLTFC